MRGAIYKKPRDETPHVLFFFWEHSDQQLARVHQQQSCCSGSERNLQRNRKKNWSVSTCSFLKEVTRELHLMMQRTVGLISEQVRTHRFVPKLCTRMCDTHIWDLRICSYPNLLTLCTHMQNLLRSICTNDDRNVLGNVNTHSLN